MDDRKSSAASASVSVADQATGTSDYIVQIRNDLLQSKSILIDVNANIAQRKKYKSMVWNIFRAIRSETGDIDDSHIACSKCYSVFNHKMGKTSTSNLHRHRCYIEYQKTRDKANENSCALETANTIKKKMPQELKNELLDSEVGFVTRDLHSFSSVEGDGLHDLLSTFTKIAIIHNSSISPEVCAQLLSSRTTVSRHTTEYAAASVDIIRRRLQSALSRGGFALTSDIWKDTKGKNYYLSLIAHCIDENGVVQVYVLSLEHIPCEQSHTSDNIRALILQVFERFSMKEDFIAGLASHSIVIITDRGRNMLAAMDLLDCDRIACFAHLMHNLSEEMCKLIAPLLTSCRNLVSYFNRKPELHNKLKTKLKSMVLTRWNTAYLMMQSILDNINDIIPILQDNDMMTMVTSIDQAQLKTIVQVLKPIYMATIDVEGSYYPTLYKVWPWRAHLTRHLEIVQTDLSDELIQNMKHAAAKYLDNTFTCTKMHKAAVLMHPFLRKLRCSESIDEQNAVKEEILEYITEWEIARERQAVKSAQSRQATSSRPPHVSSGTESFNILNMFKDSNEMTSESHSKGDIIRARVKQELEFYLNMQVDDSCIEFESQLLDWWKSQKGVFAILSPFAAFIHSVPATSASSERAFSISGNIISQIRNKLKPKTAHSLLFLKLNWDSIHDEPMLQKIVEEQNCRDAEEDDDE